MQITIVYALSLFTILFLLVEVRSLLKQRALKELTIAALILSLALLYGVDYAMEWQMLPNPNLFLKILKPVSEAFTSFFQIPG